MKHWPYETYVFDLYGTLADIRTDEEDPRFWASLAWYLRLSGRTWEPEPLRAAYRSACEENLREKAALLQRRGLPGPAEADIRQVFSTLGRMRGGDPAPEEIDRFARLFRALSIQKLRLFDGAGEVLRALRQGGRRIILLTNAQSAFTVPELAALGIAGAFDHIFISSDAGVKKPSPAFFDLAIRAGAKPEASLMIGNDDRCDCHGAAAVGMDSAYLRTEQSPPVTEALPLTCRPLPDLTAVLTL